MTTVKSKCPTKPFKPENSLKDNFSKAELLEGLKTRQISYIDPDADKPALTKLYGKYLTITREYVRRQLPNGSFDVIKPFEGVKINSDYRHRLGLTETNQVVTNPLDLTLTDWLQVEGGVYNIPAVYTTGFEGEYKDDVFQQYLLTSPIDQINENDHIDPLCKLFEGKKTVSDDTKNINDLVDWLVGHRIKYNKVDSTRIKYMYVTIKSDGLAYLTCVVPTQHYPTKRVDGKKTCLLDIVNKHYHLSIYSKYQYITSIDNFINLPEVLKYKVIPTQCIPIFDSIINDQTCDWSTLYKIRDERIDDWSNMKFTYNIDINRVLPYFYNGPGRLVHDITWTEHQFSTLYQDGIDRLATNGLVALYRIQSERFLRFGPIRSVNFVKCKGLCFMHQNLECCKGCHSANQCNGKCNKINGCCSVTYGLTDQLDYRCKLSLLCWIVAQPDWQYLAELF